jgi:hypothetical protein
MTPEQEDKVVNDLAVSISEAIPEANANTVRGIVALFREAITCTRKQTLEEVAARFDGRGSVHFSDRVASEIRSLLPPPPADRKDESRQ